MEKKELLEKLEALDLQDENARNKIVCALIGHPRIITLCFGYVNCARCGEQIGDKLGGYFDDSEYVVVGHNCETCRENYENLTWKDKLYCPDPFAEEEDE